MNNPPKINAERMFHAEAEADVYKAGLSKGVTPMRRKRNHGQVSSRARTYEVSRPQWQSDLYGVQPVKDRFVDKEDIRGTSDLETAIKEEMYGRKRSSRRSDSEAPMKQFKRPYMWDELKDEQLLDKSSPNLSLNYMEESALGSNSPMMSNDLLHISQSASLPGHTKKQDAETGLLNPTSSSLHLVPLDPATGKKFKFGSDKHINVKCYTTDSDSDSFDEIELIEKPALLPSSFRRKLKSQPSRDQNPILPQSDSRNKRFLSRPKTLSEACDVFENLRTTSALARGRDLSRGPDSDDETRFFQLAMPRLFSRDISPMPTFIDFVKRRAYDRRVTSSATTNPKSKGDARDEIKYDHMKMLPSTSDDMILSSDQPLPSIEPVCDLQE